MKLIDKAKAQAIKTAAIILLMLTPSLAFAQASVHTLAGVNAQTGTAYTIVAADQTKLLTFNNASPVAVTLPSPANTNFGIGAFFAISNIGLGTVTITPTSSTIDGNATLVLLPGQGVDIYSTGTNYNSQRGAGGNVSGMTSGQVAIASAPGAITSSKPIQGAGDPNIMGSGTVVGLSALLCTDAAGGATTVGCPSTGGGGSPAGSTGDTQCKGSSTFAACANQPAILYVSTTGNDSNSGKTWDTAKLTIMQAVCALPGGNCASTPHQAGAGTIIFASGVFCTQSGSTGCWIAGSGDSAYPSMTTATGGATAWTIEPVNGVAINFICATMEFATSNVNRPSCSVGNPNHLSGNLPMLWLTGNSTGPKYINGMSAAGGTNFAGAWGRIGIDSTTGNIIGTPTVTQTVSVTVENSWTTNMSGNGYVGMGPQLALGNGFWNHFRDDNFTGNVAEQCPVTSSSRSGNVVTVTTNQCDLNNAPSNCPFVTGDHVSISSATSALAGDNSFNGTFTVASGCSANTFTYSQGGPSGSASGGYVSSDRGFGVVCYKCQAEFYSNHFTWGGMKVYSDPNTNVQYNDTYLEDGFQPLLWTSALAYGGTGVADVSGIFLADTYNFTPGVINESMSMTLRNHSSQATFSKGPMVQASGNDSGNRTLGLLASGQSGWYNSAFGSPKFEADTDIARRQAPITSVQFANLAVQNPANWIFSVNLLTTPGKRDPFGGTGAVELGSSSGSSTDKPYSASNTITVGDYWYFGGWFRQVTPVSGNSPFQIALGGANNLCVGGLSGFSIGKSFLGDGDWQWAEGVCKIWANPTSPANIDFIINVADPSHPVQIYRPFLIKVPASTTASPTEIVDELNSLGFGPSTSAAAGDISFASDKKICMPSGSATDEFCGYFTHSNTANRTYTLPDISGTACLTATCAALATNFTQYDNFNRANGGLGSNWTTVVGGALSVPAISSNQVTGTVSAHSAAAYTGTTFSSDQFSQATIPVGGNNALGAETVTCRNTPASGNFYSFQFYNGNFNMNIFTAGVATVIGASVSGSLASGDVIRIECVGSTLTGYQISGGVKTQILQRTDATYATGSPGIDVFGNTAVSLLDNWSGGNINAIEQPGIETDVLTNRHILGALTVGVTNPIAGTLPAGSGTFGSYVDFAQQASSPSFGNPASGYCRGYFSFGGTMTFTNSSGTSCGPSGGGGSMTWPNSVGLVRWTSGTAWAPSVNDTTALTGQVLTGTNGAVSAFSSQGIQDGNGQTHVTTTPYAIACDSVSTLQDRGDTVIFDGGASVVNLPDHTASGCGNNFAFAMINNSGGNLTVNRGGTDTLDVYGVGPTPTIAATSFTFSTNTWAVVNNGEAGRWNVRLTAALLLPNTTTTTGTGPIAANSCTTATPVTMPGLATTSTITFTANADTSGIVGWGSTGGLVIAAWPTANTVNYKVCNQTGSSITPGGVTWNVSAK